MNTKITKAKIIWVDDYFLDEEFKNKNMTTNIAIGMQWESIFNSIESSIYKYLEITICMYGTSDEAIQEIENARKNENKDTFYFFILDVTLPKDYNSLDKKEQKNGAAIGDEILKDFIKDGNIEFSYLTSVTKNSLKKLLLNNKDKINNRFINKPPNQSFTIPEELQAKILFKIKNEISEINIEEKILNFLPDSLQNSIKNYFGEDKYIPKTFLYPFVNEYKKFVEFSEYNKYSCQRNTFIMTKDTIVKQDHLKYMILMYANLLLEKGKKFRYIEDFDNEIDINIDTIYCIRVKQKHTIEEKENLLKFMKKNKDKYIAYIIDEDNSYLATYMHQVKCFAFRELPGAINV